MTLAVTVSAMSDFLEEKQREITGRMDKLRPYVDEFRRLEAAQSALEGVSSSGSPSSSSSGSSSRRAPGRRGGGRPKGSGTRASEALAAVREQPGITIPELAQKLGIQQNYLYRVLPGLEQDGQVRKDGRGWFPKEAA